MHLEEVAQNTRETSDSSRKQIIVTEASFSGQPKPIVDFVSRPDFPQCTLGEFLDIGGYCGVVVEIVKQSLKVRSQEEITRSFNAAGLRKVYGPPPEIAPLPPRFEEEPAPQPPKSEVISEPDFNQPVKPVAEYANAAEFPKNAFGKLIDINGYVGVVVEITSQSIRVRSQEETSRNYNIKRVRELFGQKK